MASAGWYPDPSGQPAQRYWDGAAWSEHVRPATDWTALPQGRAARVNAPCLVLVGLGAVLLVLSFAASTWWEFIDNGDGTGAPTLSFSDLHRMTGLPSYLTMYFGWLGWVTLVLAIACGVLAGILAGNWRGAGVLFGLLGFGLLIGAMFNFADKVGASLTDFAYGPWPGVAGFALCAFGAAVPAVNAGMPPHP